MVNEEEKRYDIRVGQIAPFPKEFVLVAEDLHITEIQISFQGGSDEGYIDVECYGLTEYTGGTVPVDCKELAWGKKNRFVPDKDTPNGDSMRSEWTKLEKEIIDWAWEKYGYNGAGDGQSYGENLVINLATKKVSYNDWGYSYYENDPDISQLETKDD